MVKLLGVDDLFEGITYCDYGAEKFICKPHKDMYAKAMKEAGVKSVDDCYFIDDSYANAKAAQAIGWTTAHLVEPFDPISEEQASKFLIRDLEELRTIFPQFFEAKS